jgi:hypothetical protein
MDISRTEKKVREAEFFLGKMRKAERDGFGGNQEPFEFYLSAFLGAAASVRECFRNAQDRRASAFKHDFEGKLRPEQKSLYGRLGEERNAELHQHKPSSRKTEIEKKGFGPGTHYFGGARHDVVAPPDVQVAMWAEKKVHTFTIGGTKYIAMEACSEYFALLAQMVAEYKATQA